MATNGKAQNRKLLLRIDRLLILDNIYTLDITQKQTSAVIKSRFCLRISYKTWNVSFTLEAGTRQTASVNLLSIWLQSTSCCSLRLIRVPVARKFADSRAPVALIDQQDPHKPCMRTSHEYCGQFPHQIQLAHLHCSDHRNNYAPTRTAKATTLPAATLGFRENRTVFFVYFWLLPPLSAKTPTIRFLIDNFVFHGCLISLHT